MATMIYYLISPIDNDGIIAYEILSHHNRPETRYAVMSDTVRPAASVIQVIA